MGNPGLSGAACSFRVQLNQVGPVDLGYLRRFRRQCVVFLGIISDGCFWFLEGVLVKKFWRFVRGH